MPLLYEAEPHNTLPRHCQAKPRWTSRRHCVAARHGTLHCLCYALPHCTSPCFALPLPYSTERNYTIAELCFTSRSRTMRNDTRPLLCLAWHRCTPPCHRVTALNSAERHVALLYHCHATPYGTLPLPNSTARCCTMPLLCRAWHHCTPPSHCVTALNTAERHVALLYHCHTLLCHASPLPNKTLRNSTLPSPRHASLYRAIAMPRLQCYAILCHCRALPYLAVPSLRVFLTLLMNEFGGFSARRALPA